MSGKLPYSNNTEPLLSQFDPYREQSSGITEDKHKLDKIDDVIIYDKASYSGVDIKCLVMGPPGAAEGAEEGWIKVLGEVQTVSYQIHREKVPVRTLGRSAPKTYTKGTKTVAGSMIFTLFDRHVFNSMLLGSKLYGSAKDTANPYVTVDQLPRFDFVLYFANERGSESLLAILDLEIVNEGGVFSVNDMISEATMNWVAQHIMPLRSLDEYKRAINSKQGAVQKGKRFSDIVNQLGYKEVLASNNPFI